MSHDAVACKVDHDVRQLTVSLYQAMRSTDYAVPCISLWWAVIGALRSYIADVNLQGDHAILFGRVHSFLRSQQVLPRRGVGLENGAYTLL